MDAIANTLATGAQTNSSTPVATQNEETSSSALASDFETFLRLLTTQLQNQDPSKPMESTEFVAQLASFSAVEQQINTNTKLDELISQANGGIAGELSNWIGTKVKSGADLAFNGTPLDIFYSVPSSATAAQLIVKDDTGAEIDRRTLDIASKELVWDGNDVSGNTLPSGSYSFHVESFENSVSMGILEAEGFASVKEARLVDGAVELIFGDGTKMAATEVEAVRGN